ncbi:MAG: patatin-like phospholipase family protein, partial [bacterium]
MNEQNRKTVGLALGSGSDRGIAHIGVIQTLLKNNIPIDYISGTSIGSIIG